MKEEKRRERLFVLDQSVNKVIAKRRIITDYHHIRFQHRPFETIHCLNSPLRSIRPSSMINLRWKRRSITFQRNFFVYLSISSVKHYFPLLTVDFLRLIDEESPFHWKYCSNYHDVLLDTILIHFLMLQSSLYTKNSIDDDPFHSINRLTFSPSDRLRRASLDLFCFRSLIKNFFFSRCRNRFRRKNLLFLLLSAKDLQIVK